MLGLAGLVLGWLLVVRPLGDALDAARQRHGAAVVALAKRGRASGRRRPSRRPSPALPIDSLIGRTASEAGFTGARIAAGARRARGRHRGGAASGLVRLDRSGSSAGPCRRALRARANPRPDDLRRSRLPRRERPMRFRLPMRPHRLLPRRLCVLARRACSRCGSRSTGSTSTIAVSPRARPTGSVWLGALKEAQFGPVPLGDVDARLNPLPLFLGRARLSLARRDRATGGCSAVRSRRQPPQLRLRRRHRAVARRAPCSRRCRSPRSTWRTSARVSHPASARAAKAMYARPLPATSAASPAGRACAARCAAPRARCCCRWRRNAAWSSSTFACSSGRCRVQLAIRPTDPAAGQRLVAAGFAAWPDGYVRRHRRRLLRSSAAPEKCRYGALVAAHIRIQCERGGLARRSATARRRH